MIRIGGKEPKEIWIGRKKATALYVGLRLVWQSLRGCFGAGQWNKDESWNGEDTWMNE